VDSARKFIGNLGRAPVPLEDGARNKLEFFEATSSGRHPKAHQPLRPISAILVIRQDFLSISCAMHTRESDSYSTAALIGRDDESGRLRLSFNYANKPKATARDRMAIHYGRGYSTNRQWTRAFLRR
jgi:SMODS-associating 2TM, beta-strand rich effector domain